MIHETHYTLAEAVELVGRYLHGDVWIGGEAGVVFCWLKEDDIVMLQAGVQKAVKPSRSPGRSGSDGAPKQIMRILDHALEEGIAEEIARVEQLFVDDGSVNFKHLWGPAKDETLWRLRAGDPLTEADFIILDELEKEYHAKERRESVVLWFTNHAWSGDDSEVPLTGYISTLDDGKITPILAHCWGARSFKLSLYNNKATMDDQPWPADGTLVFLKSQLDAVLRGKQVALPSPAGRPDAATGGTDEGKVAELPELKQDAGRPPDSEQAQPSRRDQRKATTEARWDRWYEISQDIKADNKPRASIELAKAVKKREKEAGYTKANAETIKRRLNEDHEGWAD